MMRLSKSLSLFLLFLVAVVVLVILLPAAPRWNDSLHYAQIDKDSLMMNVEEPRLILLGGSNVGMSFDSQMLKDSLGLNPINAGLHAGFGIKFILDNAAQYLRKGDVVILIPEYELYQGRTFYGEGDLMNLLFDVAPEKLHLVNFEHAKHIFTLVPSYLKIKLLPSSYLYRKDNRPASYLRTAYNQYGDAVAHWGESGAECLDLAPLVGLPDGSVISYLKEWVRCQEDKGVVVCLSCPVYRKKSYDYSAEFIEKLEDLICSGDFFVLGRSGDFVMADSMFYDTRYHTNNKGAEYRTKKLIQLFRAGIDKLGKE